MQQELNQVGRLFWWRRYVAFLMKPFWRWRARRVAGHVLPFIPEGARVLDVGSGNGLIAEEIKRQKNAALSLLDVIDWNISTFPVTLFDGKHVPFGDKEFAVVTLIDVVHHSEDENVLMQEALRVAKRVVLVEEAHGTGLANILATIIDNVQYVLYGMPVGTHHRNNAQWLEFCKVHCPGARQVRQYFQHGVFVLE